MARAGVDEKFKWSKFERKWSGHIKVDSVSPDGIASVAVFTSVVCVQRLKMILSVLSRQSKTTKALSDLGSNPSSAFTYCGIDFKIRVETYTV